MATQRALYACAVHGDWEAYAGHLAPEYVSRGPDGATKDKERTIADWRKGLDHVKALDVTVDRVVEAGETAVVFARYDCVDVRCGAARQTAGTMVETFVARDGRWLCIATAFDAAP